jgi:regulator of replication initiation timing
MKYAMVCSNSHCPSRSVFSIEPLMNKLWDGQMQLRQVLEENEQLLKENKSLREQLQQQQQREQ